MKISVFVFRLWYYFRLGYGVYLAIAMGFIGMVTSLYYLMVKDVPFLYGIFPSFASFVIVGFILLLPAGILFGWVHAKRSHAFAAEFDIAVETNPYYYKLPPGYVTEAQFPVYLSIIRLLKKIGERERFLSREEMAEIEELEEKLKVLMRGGQLGTPRARR